MKTYSAPLLVLLLSVNLSSGALAQCCAGGSGSPIAGGASQGVLQEHQMELNANLQFVNTNTFLTGTESARNFLDDFHSRYLYARAAYGLSPDLTISVEGGYWLTKTQVGLNKRDTSEGHGIGDLVLFPRYTVYRSGNADVNTEVTLGLGVKIPIGSSDDSVGRFEPISETTLYLRKPLSVQLSSGAADMIFYAFAFRGYTSANINIFANALYIRKGWNAVGEKLGDFASVSVFAGTKIYSTLSGVLQVKAEHAAKMKINNDVYLYHNPGYETEWTGHSKVFVCPQLNYCYHSQLTLFAMADIPVYQNVNGTQIASQFQLSAGCSYRFMLRDPEDAD